MEVFYKINFEINLIMQNDFEVPMDTYGKIKDENMWTKK